MKVYAFTRRIAQLKRNRCGIILGSLCLFILADPLVVGSAVSSAFVGLVGVSSLTLAIWPIRRKRLCVMAFLLVGMAAAELMVELGVGGYPVRAAARGATAAFCVATIVALLDRVMDQRPITIDKVFGAISAYVMIGVLFATVYSLLQLLQPQALFVNLTNDADGMLGWSDLVYFSFTILTTTGLGEITPTTHVARSLIIVEQVLGTMYVAFLIARLANTFNGHRHDRRH
jgi:hypothetical protein